MENFIELFKRLAQALLMAPASRVEMWIVIGVAFFGGILVMKGMASAFRADNKMLSLGLFTVGLGVLLMLATSTLCEIYVKPLLPAAYGRWVIPGALVGSALVFSIPLVSAMHKMKYGPALVSWLVCLFALAALIYATNTAFGMFSSGKKSAGGMSLRKSALQEVLDQ
ncbi:MAG: hypothetical protein EOM20_17975 [Spartobacteria bacterium]|nr:hypothetical protein [Spartobacteria bacterium]